MKNLRLTAYLGLCLVLFSNCSPKDLSIDIWYGKKQSFGHPGNPQRAINILGNVQYDGNLKSLQFTLNKGEWVNLSIGRNDTRLARQGDFNIEILRTALREGKNRVQIPDPFSDPSGLAFGPHQPGGETPFLVRFSR